MSLKRTAIVVALLGLGAALSWWLFSANQHGPSDAHIGETVLDHSTARQARRISLSFDEGASIQLAKDGEHWRVASLEGLPADIETLQELFSSLTEATLDRVATNRPETMEERLEIGTTIIDLEDANGAQLARIELGKSGDRGGVFLRLNEGANAYFSNDRVVVDDTPEDWVLRQIGHWETERVRVVRATLEDGQSIRFERADAETDFSTVAVFEGEQVRQSGIESLLSELLDVRYIERVDKDDPLVTEALQHPLRYAFEDAEGHSLEWTLGRRPAVEAPATETEEQNEAEDPQESGETGQAAVEEEAPEPRPAGDAYMVLSISDPAHPWSGHAENYAYRISNYVHDRLPEERSPLFEAIPEDQAANEGAGTDED